VTEKTTYVGYFPDVRWNSRCTLTLISAINRKDVSEAVTFDCESAHSSQTFSLLGASLSTWFHLMSSPTRRQLVGNYWKILRSRSSIKPCFYINIGHMRL